MNIGKTIKEIRKRRGLKQNFIAEKTGISPEHMSNIESGNKNATIETLNKISMALNMPLFALILLATEEADIPEKGREYSVQAIVEVGSIYDMTEKQSQKTFYKSEYENPERR